MTDDVINPDERLFNVSQNQGTSSIEGDEEYEYEYIELGEGEELPEGLEYEYIEVVNGEVDEPKMPSISVAASIQVPVSSLVSASIQEPAIVSTPVLAPETSVQESVLSVPLVSASIQEPAIASTPVLAPEISVEEPVLSAPQVPASIQEPAIASTPVLAPETSVQEPVLSAPLVPASIQEPIIASTPVLAPEISVQEPVLSAPLVPASIQEPVIASTPVVASSAFVHMDSVSIIPLDESIGESIGESIVEEDLNALLDNDKEIEEFDASSLLQDDYGDDFSNKLFSEISLDDIKEVSFDDIFGMDGDSEKLAHPEIQNIEEVSFDDLMVEQRLNDENVLSPFTRLDEHVTEIENDTQFEIAAPGSEISAEPRGALIGTFEEVVSPIDEIASYSPTEQVFETEDEIQFDGNQRLDVYNVSIPEIKQDVEILDEPEIIPEANSEILLEEVSLPEISEETESVEEIVFRQETIIAPEQAIAQPIIPTSIMVNEISNVCYTAVVLDAAKREDIALKSKTVNCDSGMQFWDLKGGEILLDSNYDEISNWHMIIFNQNLVAVDMKSHQALVGMPQNAIRVATVVQRGNEKLSIYNEEEYNFTNPVDGFVKSQKHFIYGQVDTDTGLVINDFVNIDLNQYRGKIISFSTPVFGWLSGPKGAQIYFSNLKNLAISAVEQIKEDEDKIKFRSARWYSGSKDDKFFELSEDSQSNEFVGNDDIKRIHVNVGTSSYGWNVTFDGGLVMSLKDLQEFETKHGKLPSAKGEIVHGTLRLKFSNVEKIVVYQAPQYFAYGKN